MDSPRPFDAPTETDVRSADPTTVASDARLAVLASHLRAHGFEVELTGQGLAVRNMSAGGCCQDAQAKADTITCRPRGSDFGRLWFVTSWGEPLAEADRVTDAITRIKGYLGAS